MPLKNDLKILTRATEKKSAAQIAAYEKELIRQYQIALKEMKASLAKYYESNFSSQRLQGVINKIENILKDAGVKGLKTTKNGIKDAVGFNFNAVQENLRTAIGTELSFAILNEKALNSLVVNNKFSTINWQSKGLSNIKQDAAFIKSKVYQGVIQGKNYEVVARQISNQVNILTSDALRIMKTETHRAVNEARVLSMNESAGAAERLGFMSVKIWNGGEEFPREHNLMNGTSIPVKEQFTLPSGFQTEGPGLSGNPGDDINCGCYLEFDIKEGTTSLPLLESAQTEVSTGDILKNELNTKLAKTSVSKNVLSNTVFTEAELEAPLTFKQVRVFQDNIKKSYGLKVDADMSFKLRELIGIEKELTSALDEMKKASKLIKKRTFENLQFGMKIKNTAILSDTAGESNGAIGFYKFKGEIQVAAKYEYPTNSGLTIGEFSVDNSLKGTMRHEFGHYLDTYTSALEAVPRNDAGETFFRMIKKNEFTDRFGPRPVIGNNISKYAQSSLGETYAESWAAITHPNYFKSIKRLPKEIEDWFIQAFKIKIPK